MKDTMNQSEQTTAILECLNVAFKADPSAIHAIMGMRVPCNLALADHPHVIVTEAPLHDLTFQLTTLGFLNGILASAGLPAIAQVWDDSDIPNSARKLTGFVQYQKP